MLGYFIQGFVLGFPASATPGPFQAYLLSQTIKNGWRKTLVAALAPLLSDGLIVPLVLLVLTQTPEWLLSILRIVGGIFILYLARGAYHAFRDNTPRTYAETERQSLLEAALMNVLNPNPYIFWGTVGAPILLEGWRTAPPLSIAYLIGFYSTMIGGSALLIVLFGTAQKLGQKVARILSGISALALLLFGIYQLITGITPWVGG